MLDGPSLELLADRSAGRRFPFCRLSRLVVRGDVEWSHEALVACLDHGITVTFLSPDGTARGFGLPACDPATRDSQRIEEFLSRSDWSSMYSDYLRAYERREILHTLKLLHFRLADLRTEAVREAIEDRFSRWAPLGLCRQLKHALDGMLAGRIAEHLGRLQVAPSVLADRRPGFHLPRDAVRVLGWRLYADLNRFLKLWLSPSWKARSGDCRLELHQHYESVRVREDRRVTCFIDSFRFWLGGLS